jgi:uncharacterized membrane protein HdeD (DUF308 family)
MHTLKQVGVILGILVLGRYVVSGFSPHLGSTLLLGLFLIFVIVGGIRRWIQVATLPGHMHRYMRQRGVK